MLRRPPVPAALVPLLLLAGGLLARGARAQDEGAPAAPPGAARGGADEAAAALLSPLAAVRERAVARLVAAGEPGRREALALLAHPSGGVRVGALEALAGLARPEDRAALRAALTDAAPAVGQAAGAALLAGSARWGPARDGHAGGPVTDRAREALANALLEHLLPAGLAELPPEILLLGEAAVPALADLLGRGAVPERVRWRAAALIGRLGGVAAAGVLADALAGGPPGREGAFDAALLRALLDAEAEPGGAPLETAQRWVGERLAAVPHWRDLRPVAGGGWAEVLALLDFAERHPSSGWGDLLRERLGEYLDGQARGGRWRPSGVLLPVTRLLVTLGTPSDDELRLLAHIACRPAGVRRRGSSEEGAEVLLLLEPYARRAGLRRGLEEALEDHYPAEEPAEDGLPPAILAVTLHLLEAEAPAALRERAEALLATPGRAAPPGQALAAFRLLERLGGPGPELLRRVLEEGEAELVAQALPWTRRCLPAAEARARFLMALAHPNDAPFLVAAECAPGIGVDLGPAALRRLEEMALFGGLGWRQRALGVLARRAGAGPVQAAAALSADARRRRVLDLRSRSADSGPAQALPAAPGR